MTRPCSGDSTTSKASVSKSTSAPVNVIDFAVSSSVVTVCAVATGASFTAFTVMETVATPEFTAPSFTRKVKESLPFTFAIGV